MNLFKSTLLAGALALGLAGCQTSGACANDPICTAEEGVTAGYHLHTFLVNEAISLHSSGVLVGDTWVTVKTDLQNAKKYLDAADVSTTAADINANLAKANAQIGAAEQAGNLKEGN